MVKNGKVKWYDVKKGYGFITDEEGKDYFVHFTGITKGRRKINALDKFDKVEFDVELKEGTKGPQAVNVVLVDDTAAGV